MGISADRSVERCGPPDWSGTVHTHVALYTDDLPSTTVLGPGPRRHAQWYERWNADGVFCLVYSARDAHCEADGVVGGMRSGRASCADGERLGEAAGAPSGDFGLAPASHASSPQVRPARAKKKAIMRANSTR